MQLVSSRIWTRVAVSISYDDNHYTMGTPIYWLKNKFVKKNLLNEKEIHISNYIHLYPIFCANYFLGCHYYLLLN